SDFSIRERVAAAYAMLSVDLGRARVVGGVRTETTKVKSNAFAMVTKGTNLVAEPVSGSGSYTSVLPSLVTSFDLRRNLVLRGAVTRALGRPEFDAIAPRAQLGIEDNPTLGTIGRLSIGNPELKARHSWNYDTSLEWYFDEGSLVSIAVFRKD